MIRKEHVAIFYIRAIRDRNLKNKAFNLNILSLEKNFQIYEETDIIYQLIICT